MEPVTHDSFLFALVKSDDRQAFNLLFNRYYQKLCRFSYTFLKNTEDSEEVVSDVFFNIWKSRHTLQIENVQLYLYTSIKYAALATIKRQRSQPIKIYEVEDRIDESRPELNLEYSELVQQVDAVVSKLPLRCQQVFVMSRFQGMRYKEIGAVLGISEKTVENQLAKGVQLIRESMQQHLHESSLLLYS